MGVDLMGLGGGVSFDLASWQTLYDLGLAFGWQPDGTLPATISDKGSFDYPDDNHETPREGYFSNDFQWVTDKDAASWCEALEGALAALEGRAPMTLERAEAVRRIWAGENEDITPLNSCSRGDRRLQGIPCHARRGQGAKLTGRARRAPSGRDREL